MHWIRVEDYRISPEKDVIMGGLSAEECKKACNVLFQLILMCSQRANVPVINKQA